MTHGVNLGVYQFFPPFLVAIVVFSYSPIFIFDRLFIYRFFIGWVVIAALFFVDIIDDSINYLKEKFCILF